MEYEYGCQWHRFILVFMHMLLLPHNICLAIFLLSILVQYKAFINARLP